MKTSRWNPKGPVVIVESGVEWLKVARVQSHRGKCDLHSLHVRRVDSSVGIGPKEIAEGIKAVRGSGLPILACLPRQMVTIRFMELPSTDPVEIADMIDLQAARQTPYSKDEIACDYRPVGCPRDGYTAVMLAIAQKAVLRQRYFVFEEAGLEIAKMTVASEGLLSWHTCLIRQDERNSSLALLDVDSGTTDLILLEKSRPVFARNLLIGSGQLLSAPDVWRGKFLEEIQRSVEAYGAECPSFRPVKIVVTGGGVKIQGISDLLREALSVPVECRDSLELVSGQVEAARSVVDQGVSLTSLIGLGATLNDIEFNFIPETFTLRRDLVRNARRLTTLTSLVMTCMVAGSMYGLLNVFERQYRLDRMTRELSVLEPDVKRVETMLDIARAVQARVRLKGMTVEVVGEMHGAAAETGVLLDSVSFDMKDGRAQLEGSGGSWQDVRNFVGKLEQSAGFRNVREEGSSALDPKSGRYRFRISCILEK